MKKFLSRTTIIAAAAALAALIGCGIYLVQNTEAKLLAKGWQAEFQDNDQAKADKFYTRLSNKWSSKASGTGYLMRFGLYTRAGQPDLAAEMLRKAAEKENTESMFKLAHALLDGGDPANRQYIPGIGENVSEALALLETLTDETRFSYDEVYEARCDIAEVCIFDPVHTDYEKAAELVRNYFTGSYTKRFPRARHLAAMLEYMWQGGFGNDQNPGHASSLLNDATDGMAAYYHGNCWLRRNVYSSSERLEFCLNKALAFYRSALNRPSRYIDREDLARRIAFLEEYSKAQFAANDRSSFYGQDRYYGVGSVDPDWDAYFNYNDFHYDGRRGGNGIGAGSWPRQKRLFCGTWRNNRLHEGIYVDEHGTVFTGLFNASGRYVQGTSIDKDNRKRKIG